MKIPIYLIVLIFAMVVINTSCNDENIPDDENPEAGRQRITKMADNVFFDNAISYKYNPDNHLVEITSEHLIYEIDYNDDDNPIKVVEREIDNSNYSTVTDIRWTNNGFILNRKDSYNEVKEFLLDSEGRIVSVNNERDNVITKDYYKLFWYGTDSLTAEYTPMDDISKYKFNKYFHPFSGINLAVIIATDGISDWSDWQNKYCVSDYVELDYFKAKVFYTVNEQNFPTVMEIKFSDYNESDFVYFEYEPY